MKVLYWYHDIFGQIKMMNSDESSVLVLQFVYLFIYLFIYLLDQIQMKRSDENTVLVTTIFLAKLKWRSPMNVLYWYYDIFGQIKVM